MSYVLEGYVDVAERLREFRAKYPNGCLRPANPDEPFKLMEIGGREWRAIRPLMAFPKLDCQLGKIIIPIEGFRHIRNDGLKIIRITQKAYMAYG